MVRALEAGVLVAVLCAIAGTFVVLRGLAFIGDALAHGVLPGIAGALLLGLPGLGGGFVRGGGVIRRRRPAARCAGARRGLRRRGGDDRRREPGAPAIAPVRRHRERPAVRRDARP